MLTHYVAEVKEVKAEDYVGEWNIYIKKLLDFYILK